MARKLLAFVAIGSCFATVEEFLTVVVLRHDVASYVFTVVVLFPAFLLFVAGTSHLTDRLVRRESLREPVHFITYGLVGLMIEWFLIGLTPWSNPDAPVVLMVLFQVGMFSFWATVAYCAPAVAEPRRGGPGVPEGRCMVQRRLLRAGLRRRRHGPGAVEVCDRHLADRARLPGPRRSVHRALHPLALG